MDIQRYEIDIDVWEDEEGTENILAPHKHPAGDWCKAEDVQELLDEHRRLQLTINILGESFTGNLEGAHG